MSWSWAGCGFMGGLFVGVLLQNSAFQQVIWSLLPVDIRLIWYNLSFTLYASGLQQTWHILLLYGVGSALAALLLQFLLRI